MKRICVICAIGQETSPLLRRFSKVGRSRITGILSWEFTANGNRIHLLQSGIGISRAVRAAEIAIDRLNPDLVISAGFCGALFPEIEIGDIIIAAKLHHYSAGVVSQELGSDAILPGTLNRRFRSGIFISSEEIVAKKTLINHVSHFASAATVLEMESWGVAKVCRERGVAFTAIRAVSDTAENDPAELFRNICDHEFTISLKKIAMYLLKKPLMIRQLLQLGKNAGIAGRSLADTLHCSLGKIQ